MAKEKYTFEETLDDLEEIGKRRNLTPTEVLASMDATLMDILINGVGKKKTIKKLEETIKIVKTAKKIKRRRKED